jgi:hypothetical protein
MRGLRLLVLCALAASAVCAAEKPEKESAEDVKRRIRLKTSRQLKEILRELDISVPSGISKEELRSLVFKKKGVRAHRALASDSQAPHWSCPYFLALTWADCPCLRPQR